MLVLSTNESWVKSGTSMSERYGGAEALAAAGLEPIKLAAKEGLSLINGTQFMASMAALALVLDALAKAVSEDRKSVV